MIFQTAKCVVARYYMSLPFMPWQQIDNMTYHRKLWSFAAQPEGLRLAKVEVAAETMLPGESFYWKCDVKDDSQLGNADVGQ
jgi:hypothetical protein